MAEPGPGGLAAVVAQLEGRPPGRVVVFTYGCFELLQPGHADRLRRARALGDFLVVGVCDDAAVAALRGPGRPLVPLGERLRLVRAVRWVDAVVPVADPRPLEAIVTLRPQVVAEPTELPLGGALEAAVRRGWRGRVVALGPLGRGSTAGLLAAVRRAG